MRMAPRQSPSVHPFATASAGHRRPPAIPETPTVWQLSPMQHAGRLGMSASRTVASDAHSNARVLSSAPAAPRTRAWPRAKKRQQILAMRNRHADADSGLAVWSPHCQNSRSVVSSVTLVAIFRRAWYVNADSGGTSHLRFKKAARSKIQIFWGSGRSPGTVHARHAQVQNHSDPVGLDLRVAVPCPSPCSEAQARLLRQL